MKKQLIILSFIISVTSFGQSYISFPDSGAVWKETYWWQPSPFFYNGIGDTYIEGDTIINDTIYKKIYNLRRDVFCSSIIISEPEYNGGLREDTITKKVFYRASNFLGEKLLYDYNLIIGDTLPADMNWFSYYSGVYITDIDTIVTQDNISRRIWHLDFEQPFEGWPQIIEGIGSTSGLLGGIEPYWEGWNELLCFSIEGDDVWRNYRDSCFVITDSCTTVGLKENTNSEIVIYPNPFNDIITVRFQNTNRTYEVILTDLFGITFFKAEIDENKPITELNINENLKRGIYILSIKTNDRIIKRSKIIKK